MKKDNLLYISDIQNAIDWILNDKEYYKAYLKFGINYHMLKPASGALSTMPRLTLSI